MSEKTFDVEEKYSIADIDGGVVRMREGILKDIAQNERNRAASWVSTGSRGKTEDNENSCKR